MSEVWTVDDVLALRPCDAYARERVMDVFAGREALTAQDVAALAIPAEDRLWALLRMLPRERWLPAIYAAADRAVRIYAPAALRAAGLGAEALRLEAVSVINDATTAGAAGAAAWAAWDARAAGAAGDAAWAAGAAGDAAWAAGDAAWAAWAARVAGDAGDAAWAAGAAAGAVAWVAWVARVAGDAGDAAWAAGAAAGAVAWVAWAAGAAACDAETERIVAEVAATATEGGRGHEDR
jgi:hypothetical protein